MQPEKCFNCKSEVSRDEVFCSECGFPQNGTDEEKNKFEYRIKIKKDAYEEAQKKVRGVRTLLFVLAGINVLAGCYYLFFSGNETFFADGIATMVSALVFIGCAIWVNKQPLTGILAAFIFWIVLQVLSAVVLPETLLKGIIWKIIIIGVFIKGINSAKDASKYSEQLSAMKAK